MNDLRRRRLQGSSVTINAQRYIIKDEIGAGGSYLIYLAEPEKTPNQKVVIREFYPMDASAYRDEQGNLHFDEQLLNTYREEFCREQNNAVIVTSEITQATAAWFADPNTFCAVMQIFSGDSKTLYELLTEWEDMPPDRDVVRLYISLSIISALLSSLETLHTNRKVQRLHCDLSYYNVKVSGNLNDFKHGDHLSVQIFDFGSMVELDANHQYSATSMEELPASTPSFRPCELEGCPTVLSPATDLYSVTVLLYSLVCGQNCTLSWLNEQDISSIHQWMVNCDFFAVEDDLQELGLSDVVRSSLFRILKKGMALEPLERYQTALEMQSDIDHLANWIRPFQIDDLRDEMYLHNQSIHDHSGIYHLGVQHQITSKLFSKLCDPDKEHDVTINSDDDAPPLYHYLNDGWKGAESFQHLILSGEGGSGKSTSLLETASILQAEAVPVLYVPLNALTAQEHPLERYLQEVVFPNHENALGVLRSCCRRLRNVPAVPQVVFFLDGVNEINASVRSAAIDDIQTWMGYDNLQIVIAGRSDISNYQAFFKENTPRLQLQPLEEEQVEQYLKEYRLLPADPDAVSVLYNPLMLVLYVNTALYQKENPKLANCFRPELTQGAILWNYIEAQVIKNSKQHPTRVQAYAIKVAAHYAAAWIGWAMGNQYALDKAELIDTLDEFFKQYDCWKNIRELKSCGVTYWQPEPYELVELLTEELCILAVDKGMYSFQHQIFRDYYAAAAMEHDAMVKNPEQSELWKCAPGYIWNYVCDLLAGLLTEEKMDQIWNSMRGVDVERRSYSMYKLVGVAAAKNKDDLSNVDFSEMDLRTVSLVGKRIDAKDKHVSFKNARIGETTFANNFANNRLPRKVDTLKVSPDGRTVAIIDNDDCGCFIDMVTGRIVVTFPVCHECVIEDLCWASDSTFISFWVWKKGIKEWGMTEYCNYYTVDLSGNVKQTEINFDRGERRPVSLRCGQTQNSIIKLFYNDPPGFLSLQGYSLHIKFLTKVLYEWSYGGERLFIVLKDDSLSGANEKKYQIICFDLRLNQMVLETIVPFCGNVSAISSSPNGECLVIQVEVDIHESTYYLIDVQKRALIDLQVRKKHTIDDCKPIWTADGSNIVLHSSVFPDEIALFQLDSLTSQKIQIQKMAHGKINIVDSFIREEECYLVYLSYDCGWEEPDLLRTPKETFLEIYSLKEKRCLPICHFPFLEINEFNWMQDDQKLSACLGCKNGNIFRLNVQKKCCEKFEFFGGNSRMYSPNGKYFVKNGNSENLLEIWDAVSDQKLFEIYTYKTPHFRQESMWLADSSGLLVPTDDTIYTLYRISGQKNSFRVDDSMIGEGPPGEICCSTTGKYIALYGYSGKMSVYNLNGDLSWTDTGCNWKLIAWAPDERYMLYVKGIEGRWKLRKYDLERKRPIPITGILLSEFFPLAYSNLVWAYKKNLVAFSTLNQIYLFSLKERSKKELTEIEPFFQCNTRILQISFSPDEKYLACYDKNGGLYIFHVEDHYGYMRYGYMRYRGSLHTKKESLYWNFKPLLGMNLVNADFTGAKFANEETREFIRQNGSVIDNSTVEASSGQTVNPRSNEIRNE